jgi:hypothetical protein
MFDEELDDPLLTVGAEVCGLKVTNESGDDDDESEVNVNCEEEYFCDLVDTSSTMLVFAVGEDANVSEAEDDEHEDKDEDDDDDDDDGNDEEEGAQNVGDAICIDIC